MTGRKPVSNRFGQSGLVWRHRFGFGLVWTFKNRFGLVWFGWCQTGFKPNQTVPIASWEVLCSVPATDVRGRKIGRKITEIRNVGDAGCTHSLGQWIKPRLSVYMTDKTWISNPILNIQSIRSSFSGIFHAAFHQTRISKTRMACCAEKIIEITVRPASLIIWWQIRSRR